MLLVFEFLVREAWCILLLRFLSLRFLVVFIVSGLFNRGFVVEVVVPWDVFLIQSTADSGSGGGIQCVEPI